jgi:hypothetical protein
MKRSLFHWFCLQVLVFAPTGVCRRMDAMLTHGDTRRADLTGDRLFERLDMPQPLLAASRKMVRAITRRWI